MNIREMASNARGASILLAASDAQLKNKALEQIALEISIIKMK